MNRTQNKGEQELSKAEVRSQVCREHSGIDLGGEGRAQLGFLVPKIKSKLLHIIYASENTTARDLNQSIAGETVPLTEDGPETYDQTIIQTHKGSQVNQ